MKYKLFLLNCFLSCFLMGCGFHLRGQSPASNMMRAMKTTIYLKTANPYDSLSKTLHSLLQTEGVTVVESPERAAYILEIEKEETATQSVGFGFSTQVSMNTITYSIKYRLTDRQQGVIIPWRTISSVRNFAINTNQALMGNVVPSYLLVDMRRDVANQLMDQLTAISTAKVDKDDRNEIKKHAAY